MLRMTLRRASVLVFLLAAVAMAPSAALAQAASTSSGQAWPTKPVKFVVPFPPGGSVDPLARLLGAKLGESLGQQFIVENRPGASGAIGTAYAAKQPADGYTFVITFDTHAIIPFLQKLPYDTEKDFDAVMLVGTAPLAITTQPSKPYRGIEDVIKAAKAKPDSITFGSIGNGSVGHLSMTVFAQQAGIKLVHVPYKGGGPMMQDALGGAIELGVASVAALAANIKGGKLRAIATTGKRRANTVPDAPALAERGFPEFNAVDWWAIFTPAGTPKPVVDKMYDELVKALKLTDVHKNLSETLGMDILGASPQATQRFLLAEMARWGKVVRDNDIRTD
jgi:tripartite-type tricarboxylate transporter receptor subunit TctC